MTHQPGILAEVPRHARHVTLALRSGADATAALAAVRAAADGDEVVVGVGPSLAAACGAKVEGLRVLPALVGPGIEVPSTPAALWCWVRGDDRGAVLHRTRDLAHDLQEHFDVDSDVDAFQYGPSLDLTGYEDGTENPKGDDARRVAIAADGSSLVAVQTWVHDLDEFEAMPAAEQDFTIGRRHSDNEELDDAPESAHVKRTAQESFSPEAFVVRRSMPWASDDAEGLVFVAFGATLDAFEVLLRRMVGEEDGITDALFRFTRPVSGAAFWCPPMSEGKLDLGALSP